MKTQLKKLSAFIMIIMMFSGFIQSVSAQRKCKDGICPSGYDCVNNICVQHTGGYFCKCGSHGYGCGGNHACINFCVSYCGWFAKMKKESDDETFLKGIYHPTLQQASKSLILFRLSKILDWNNQLTSEMLENDRYELDWKITQLQESLFYPQFDKVIYHEVEKLCVLR